MHTDRVRLKGVALPVDWPATPAVAFSHPGEVLDHPSVSHAERHLILASWASDVRAVEHTPWLRRLDNGANIRLSKVLQALKAFDAVRPKQTGVRRREETLS
jgi:hypothetical protein